MNFIPQSYVAEAQLRPTVRVIIVNGSPRSGKDTTVHFMEELLAERGVATHTFSSIDPVREMLESIGVDTSKKTPSDRQLLASIGSALEAYQFRRTAICMQEIVDFQETCHQRQVPGVVFLHVREIPMIERIITLSASIGIRASTVLVHSERAEIPHNPIDAGVDQMVYDIVVPNNGTRGELFDNADAALFMLEAYPSTPIDAALES